ncbi:MAG: hypothetical protein ACLUNX_07465 [Angelakisella sp.]
MTRTREISGSGQIFALLVLSQCFWLLCCRPSLVNGLLSMAASAVAYGVVFLLAVFCRRCAARGETPLSPVFAAWGALLAVGYFAVTAEQLLSAARVLFEGVFSPLLLLLVLLGAVWAAAVAGQEALGRAAFVSLFLFLIAVLLLTLGVLPQATALNLRLPEEDLSRLGEEILFILPRQAEPLLLLLFAQRCSRSRSAALLLWVPAGWLLGGLLLLLAALVLGHYGSLQPYPMMQLARSAGLSGMVPVYCFLLITAAFFRLTGLAVAAARLGGMAGCPPKCSLWAGVALSIGGVVLLHYTGWPDAAVYPILAVTGLLWLILPCCRRGAPGISGTGGVSGQQAPARFHRAPACPRRCLAARRFCPPPRPLLIFSFRGPHAASPLLSCFCPLCSACCPAAESAPSPPVWSFPPWGWSAPPARLPPCWR